MEGARWVSFPSFSTGFFDVSEPMELTDINIFSYVV